MKTVEIKARIRDYDDLIKKIYNITRGMYSFNSTDKFYEANNGKLMLREFENNDYVALISYKRSDEEGLQVCTSYGSLLKNNKLLLLENMLNLTNGYLGIVEKKRQAYYTEEAQIVVDNIDTLGDFVKIKIANTDIEIAKKIVNDLMQKLSITSDDLITKSYIDLILEEKTKVSSSKVSNRSGTFDTSNMCETPEMSDVSSDITI